MMSLSGSLSTLMQTKSIQTAKCARIQLKTVAFTISQKQTRVIAQQHFRYSLLLPLVLDKTTKQYSVHAWV